MTKIKCTHILEMVSIHWEEEQQQSFRRNWMIEIYYTCWFERHHFDTFRFPKTRKKRKTKREKIITAQFRSFVFYFYDYSYIFIEKKRKFIGFGSSFLIAYYLDNDGQVNIKWNYFWISFSFLTLFIHSWHIFSTLCISCLRHTYT